MTNERSSYIDRDSGVKVTQLTHYRGHSHHFYFTNSGWYAGGKKLLFASDRNNRSNLYSVEFATGEIEQLTDLEPVPPPRELEFVRASAHAGRGEAYFFHDSKLMALDLNSKGLRTLFELEPGWSVSMTNASADGAYVYFGIWEDLSNRFEVDLLRGYVGFEETWAAKPLSRIMRVATDGGGGETVFEEHCWIGHVNTLPTRSGLLTFCHEGPWDKVDNRIWGLNAETDKVWKIRETASGEVVGHEYWYADGLHIGYHGHVGGTAILGRVRFDDTGRLEHAFPGETGHIFSLDKHLVVGDGGGVIRLWKWDGERYGPPRILCRHDSSSHIQQTHPHPRLSPDGRYVVFTSDRSGYGNVYTVPLVDVETLPLAPT